jgi:hypothetical protein
MTAAAGWLRRAGHGQLPDGSDVTWSIAQGRRGRRWREVRVGTDGPISSLLLETDSDGRFNHLELSTAAGLLTLHPEANGTIHGNTVGAQGVGHIVGLPWLRDGIVLLDGSAITIAAAACLLRGSLSEAATTTPALLIGLDLGLAPRQVRVERLPYGTWHFEGHDPIGVGVDGVPSLRAADDWPLEE